MIEKLTVSGEYSLFIGLLFARLEWGLVFLCPLNRLTCPDPSRLIARVYLSVGFAHYLSDVRVKVLPSLGLTYGEHGSSYGALAELW